jgi:N-acyl-phosphatidylethanolamine-hydrolysing phospholipase D
MLTTTTTMMLQRHARRYPPGRSSWDDPLTFLYHNDRDWNVPDVTMWESIKYWFRTRKFVKDLISPQSLLSKNIEEELPVVLDTDWNKIPEEVGGILYYWVGHSTFLIIIRIEDDTFGLPSVVRILTDPIFGDHASPVKGHYTRYRPVPILVENLPSIDVVLLSHDHYDHLCRYTIGELEKHHKPLYLVPASVWEKRLSSMDVPVGRCQEMNWGDTTKHNHVSFTCTPACHNSGRGLMDRDETLWCGWIIRVAVNNKVIYFVGDSAYCSLFKDIGRKDGPIDLSIIPIGCGEGRDDTSEHRLNDRRFLETQHINVEEAMKVYIDTKSKRAVGCHWGTFALTGEPILGPRDRLRNKVAKEEDMDFSTMFHGEMRSL